MCKVLSKRLQKQYHMNTEDLGNEIQINFYFNELYFLNFVSFFFLFSHSIENKTQHIQYFPEEL